jgi:transposase-like protein
VGTSVEHTSGSGARTAEVRTRKRRSIQKKLEIVRETLQTRASVAVIARHHGVNANQVFAWRRQYQRGQLVEAAEAATPETVIVPVRLAEPEPARAPSRTVETSSRVPAGPRIEIELAEGARLKIWEISSETLRALIRDLMRSC